MCCATAVEKLKLLNQISQGKLNTFPSAIPFDFFQATLEGEETTMTLATTITNLPLTMAQ